MVAVERTVREAAHVVGEELADWLDPNVKLIGLGVRKRDGNVVDGWHGLIVGFASVGSFLALGGADALTGLDEVAFDGFGA